MKNMWAVKFKFGDKQEWEQLDFFESPQLVWFGPLFWPSDVETPEEAEAEFRKSLSKRPIIARVIGHYEKQENSAWRLIPLK